MLNIIRNTINRVFASGVDSDASAFITATGLSGTTQKSAITTLVKDLKASGLWSKMKAVYPMVTDNYNLISYSEDFSNAFWAKYNLTLTTNVTTAPNGTLTADSILETAVTNYHGFECNAFTLVNGSTYTQSIYVKPIGRRYIALTSQYGAGTYGAWFDTTNVTVFSQDAGITAAIQDAGNGWFRLSITRTTASTTGYMNVWLDDSTPSAGVYYSGNTYLGDVTKGFYIWGAQVEQSSSASTYQPILTTPSAFMASQMKYNLKDARDLDAAFRLTWSGGWTYSATGATPNGTNAYADTKLVPSANLSTNNTHIASYIRNTSQGVLLGADNAYRLWIAPNFNGISKYAEINNGATTTPGSPISSSIGLWLGSRINTSTVKLYNNSSINYTYNILSSGLDTSAIYLSARNATGASNYSSSQVAFSSIGDGLSDQDTLLLNQIVEKYQVALSRGVQAAQSFYYNSAFSNEANTYLYSTQITGTTQVSAINTLINGLKANNLWSKMKAVYPFVTDYINMLGYTEDFTNAFWNKYNSTIAGNTTTSPIGTLTADSFNDGALNAQHQVYAQINSLPIGTYTFSIYLKQNTNTKNIALYPFGTSSTGGTGSGGVILTQTGTFVANIGGGVVSYGSQDVGNGWIRFYVVGTSTAISNIYPAIAYVDGTNVSYAGTNTDSYIWGAQFELGTLSAYQPILGANNYATNVAAQMKFNLVNPQDSDAAFRLAFSGGWTYSTNGAQPNGTNGYADTKLVPSGLTAQNSLHISAYLRTDIIQNSVVIGGYDGVVETSLYPRFTGNIIYAAINSNTGSSAGSSSSSLGNFIASRLISTQENTYIGNIKLTRTQLSLNNLTRSIFIGALNYLGGANVYSSRQTAFATIGDGLTDAEAALLYTLVQQFQTDLSRQV